MLRRRLGTEADTPPRTRQARARRPVSSAAISRTQRHTRHMNRLSSRDVARTIALAAAYAVTAAIGLRLGATLHDTPPLWPAAGVAIAALCIGGLRLWPGVALGTLIIIAPRGNGAVLTAAIAAATTVEALVAAWLLTGPFAFRPDLRRARDACTLVLAGGVVAPALGAAIGAGAFAMAGA